MDSDIQRCLEGVQKDVNLTLRKLHNESGTWDETVTAIVSTILQSDTDNVKSFIILFGGVLSSKDNSLPRGEGRSGMILQLKFTAMSNASPHHPDYRLTVYTSANQQYMMNLFHWSYPDSVVS